MHALFHIKTVIIPRDRYRPEGFSPRVDIGRGMITVLAWISRNKLKSKLRLKSEILLKFEKSQKNAFLEKKLSTNFNST